VKYFLYSFPNGYRQYKQLSYLAAIFKRWIYLALSSVYVDGFVRSSGSKEVMFRFSVHRLSS